VDLYRDDPHSTPQIGLIYWGILIIQTGSEAMEYANLTNATIALPILESFLTNTSDVLRSQTVIVIGQMPIDLKTKTRVIIHTVESQTNVTVKCMALRACRQLGRNEDVIAVLQEASKDNNESIRYSATQSLRAIENNTNR
jgi:hypothetical protein